MSYRLLNLEQRSPAWFAARCGRVTGTAAAALLSTIKSGEAAARRDLRTRIVCERLTGALQEDSYVNADMQRGIELEAEARAAYEGVTGSFVTEVGFLQHDELLIGCSPDGLLENGKGILELKCPKAATHLSYWRGTGLPSAYVPQVTHNLYVSGAEYCDFASYDPRFPERLQLFRVRVARSDLDLAAYDRALRTFLREVETELQAVQTLATLSQTLEAACR